MTHSDERGSIPVVAVLTLMCTITPAVRAQSSQPAAAKAVAAPCQSDLNRRRFDFWVGEWNVENRAGQPAGKSSVQRVSGGCALLENWTAPNGSTGKSLNTYNPEVGHWQQFWVGQFGAVTEYRDSEWRGDTLVFHAVSRPAGGKETLVRLSFAPLADGRVRQFGEQSTDGGKTWTVGYELFYRRSSQASGPEPKNGAEVLQRMHDAYAGKWYSTLTFTQKTTQFPPDKEPVVSTWHESLRYAAPVGAQLRIDIGDLAAGNGVLYTADSTWRVQGGKLVAARAGGNEFLPMIEGVYMQPVDRTIRELETTHVDMQRVTSGRWHDRPVWIVGIASPADTTSPQFWIDVDRNVVVRMILSPAPSSPVLDIRLEGYVELGGGWLATKIEMYSNGKPRQFEEYSDWKANVDLSPALFDVASWTTAPHWAKRPPN
ncbi:MAG: hypothetical protein ACM3SX_18265 [Deltaproteobacteria bacterium]